MFSCHVVFISCLLFWIVTSTWDTNLHVLITWKISELVTIYSDIWFGASKKKVVYDMSSWQLLGASEWIVCKLQIWKHCRKNKMVLSRFNRPHGNMGWDGIRLNTQVVDETATRKIVNVAYLGSTTKPRPQSNMVQQFYGFSVPKLILCCKKYMLWSGHNPLTVQMQRTRSYMRGTSKILHICTFGLPLNNFIKLNFYIYIETK